MTSLHFAPQEKVALFIDGANLYAAARSLGFDVDYRALLQFFRADAHLLRAYYYSAVVDTEEYTPLKPLTDWLAYNGYTLITKPARDHVDAGGRRRVRGNMEVELAIDMLEMSEHIDHAVLFSGDSDLRRLVEAVQRRGVRVSLISSIRTAPPMAADDLRRQADQFIELGDIAGAFTRRPSDVRSRLPRPMVTDTADAPLSRQTPGEPPPDCPSCPRLVAYRAANRLAEPGWFNAPVPCFGALSARLLVVGLAPGVSGANRTGRPFTGDHAGILLYATLQRYGFAAGEYAARPDDGLRLVDCRIVNAVRCVPPANRPLPAEIATCNAFLAAAIAQMTRLQLILALGVVAHDAVLRARGLKKSASRFAHGTSHRLPDGLVLTDSYHVSRYNTSTRRLTEAMFQQVVGDLRHRLPLSPGPE